MFPAWMHAKINGRPVPDVIGHHGWLQNEFVETVGKRGAAIIAARGASSAASAGNALIDHVKALNSPGTVSSIAVKSGGAYGFDPDVWAGMPVKTTAPGEYQILTDYTFDDYGQQRLAKTNGELVEERQTVSEMLG
jgi:malate dehydrogenase